MSTFGTTDFWLEAAKGNISGHVTVNKFGRATDCDSGVDCDVWDGANATDAQDIWTAPTAARAHQVVSSSTSDTSGGAGAQQVQVYGLTDWDTKEVSEVVTLNGTTNVATTNSYVIIHRIKVISFGASGPNVGQITATADTDSTVTAQILIGEGQTQMAIYGIPSTQTAYMAQYYASANKGSTSLEVNISVLLATLPATQPAVFLTKLTYGLNTEGVNAATVDSTPPRGMSGPAIIKIQANASSNNVDVSAGFNMVLVDK